MMYTIKNNSDGKATKSELREAQKALDALRDSSIKLGDVVTSGASDSKIVGVLTQCKSAVQLAKDMKLAVKDVF